MLSQGSRLKHPIRDLSKFASHFTRWAYFACGKEFYLTDNDGIFYKKSNRLMIVVEFKWWMEELTDSQKCILPIQQRMIDSEIESKFLHPLSGAFVVRGDVRHSFLSTTIAWNGKRILFPAGARIQQPWKRRECSIDTTTLIQFLSCEPLELPWKSRYE